MKSLLRLTIVLLFVLTLCACGQETAVPSDDTKAQTSTETTAPPSTETTEPLTAEQAPTEMLTTQNGALPVEPLMDGEPIDEFDIANYQQLFSVQYDRYASHPINWYNIAMCIEFDCAENINWNLLFYNGTSRYEDGDLSDSERSYLEQQNFPLNLDTVRLNPEKMNEIAEQYFGVTIQTSNQVGLEALTFFSETGCYYRTTNDVMYKGEFTIYAGYVLENGDVCLFYTDDFEQHFAMTLRSKNGETGYHIISNLQQKDL